MFEIYSLSDGENTLVLEHEIKPSDILLLTLERILPFLEII